jgi:hypothetical protein
MSTNEHSNKNRYVDLKINGRLFPSWILANFKSYKLPEIITLGDDPCNVKTDTGAVVKKELKRYQLFLSQFLDFKSPFRNVLIYHGLGSGKTASAINIYNALYSYTPGWNVFILIKASLKGTWLKELKKWLRKDDYEYRYKNIIFIHYDSPIADRQFFDAMKNVDSSKKSLYIIDEVHNFIRNVYSNISSSGGKRAQTIYDNIIQDKKENPDTRVVLISGTPAINNPFELALLFNLLRPGIFPKSEAEFNHNFISTTSHETMNMNTKNMFQRRIMGLVSYYLGATPDYYASKTLHYLDVPMSEYHEQIYNIYEDIEKKIALKSRGGKGGSQVYKSYTRQASNFVFPPISQRINGEQRPRPNKFRISEREAEKLGEGRDVLKSNKDSEKVLNVSQYKNALKSYIDGLRDYFTKYNKDDIAKKHTIQKDIDTFHKKYNGDFQAFNNEEKQKSTLYSAMYMCSAKMLNIIFNIMISPGPTIVYSNYVLMEGLQVFKVYLEFFNFYSYMETKELIPGKLGYTEFHGDIKTVEERTRGMDAYNQVENKHGKDIKIMLISPAGSEGLSLSNVRQIHIMEPYWNEVRITQMIGRGIRNCSHADLPLEERHVDVYRYKSVKSAPNSWTTDQYIEDLARSKESMISAFLDAMKEVAIDCELNKKHNMLVQEYKCFKFDEPSLFDGHIGPAYKEDFHDDMKLYNGSNSTKSVTMKIKVLKIKAVKLISNPEADKPEYSKSNVYWYYSKSGVVYDNELHYAIGKVAVDNDGLPIKIDKDTYVIDYVIPIPMIDEQNDE